jgi:hypothetical protein
MSRRFLPNGPLPLGQGSGGGVIKQLRRLGLTFLEILRHAILPFNPQPEEPDPLPTDPAEIDEKQLDLAQWMFDQAEVRRTHVEQKAQSTFSIIIFLVPVIASVYVYLAGQINFSGNWKALTMTALAASAVLLLLGFVSAARAVYIQWRQTLFLDAIIDPESGAFRKYDQTSHARGLLYCASMNTVMNDHVAQFVKGAQALSAVAVILLASAAVPASMAVSSHTTSPVQAAIVGPVRLSSDDLTALNASLSQLRMDLQALSRNWPPDEQMGLLQKRIGELETQLNAVEKRLPPVRKRP